MSRARPRPTCPTRARRLPLVRLTDAGRVLVDDTLPAQLSYETAVLSGLDGTRQRDLAALLGDLLVQSEGRLRTPHV